VQNKICTRCKDDRPIELFQKRTNRPSRDSWCQRCRSQAQCQRKKNQCDATATDARWHSNWVAITDEQARKISGAARRFAFSRGHGWIADELASKAVIETAQGNNVNFKFMLFDLLKGWCGKTGSARNAATELTEKEEEKND